MENKLQQGIPKIIHYCWFGESSKSELIQQCIKSWGEFLPDYKLREWTNADLQNINNRYLEEAVAHKKWAFVSDYMRLHALEKEGGIYFDTDVEAKKSFDKFLSCAFFIGCEQDKKSKTLATAVIGAVPHHSLIQKMLQVYDEIPFIKEDGEYDMQPNPTRFSNFFIETLRIPNVFCEDREIEIADNSFIFPYDFLSKPSPNSYAVHHFAGTWLEPYARRLICRFGSIQLVRYKKRKIAMKGDTPQIYSGEKLLFNIPICKKRHYAIMLLHKK